MAARGSFQKRQKEAARREKRQMKLDRRQGKQPEHGGSLSGTAETDQSADSSDGSLEIASIPPDPLTSSADKPSGE